MTNPGTADAGMPAGATSPFEAFGVPAYVTKVKTMLTGLAPTQSEIDQVTANAGALRDLVTTWMTLPAYAAKMEVFFADAFQQSGAQAIGFVTQLDDGSISPFDEPLQNFRRPRISNGGRLGDGVRPAS